MNHSCSELYTTSGEYTQLDECLIPVMGVMILKCLLIGGAAVTTLVQFILTGIRREYINQRPILYRVLTINCLIHPLLLIALPSLELGLQLRPVIQLWIQLIAHGIAISSASIVLQFIYLQLRIIHKGTVRVTQKSFKQKRYAIITSYVLVLLLFGSGPFLAHYGMIPTHYSFWIPVLIVDCSSIPYFCYAGLSIYFEINRMTQRKYVSLAKQILTVVIITALAGLFTCLSALIVIFQPNVDWIMADSAWLSNLVVNGLIFTIVTKKPARSIGSSTSDTPGSSSDN